MASTKKILLIVTSHEKLGETGERTGFWLEELAAPYREFVNAGATVDIASPRGGRPPTDPKSESTKNEAVAWFLADPEATAKLDKTIPIREVAPNYDAYFVVGGHGAMWDLAESADLQDLLVRAFQNGHVVAAVCHGPGALVNVKLASGDPLVKGRRVAGFSNEEEDAVGLTKVVPFSLETRLRELGGLYEQGPMWAPFAVRDGKLITGQNPSSSTLVAQETLAALASV